MINEHALTIYPQNSSLDVYFTRNMSSMGKEILLEEK